MDAVTLRRFFHRHAEVGFTEFRTAGKTVELLQSFGYQVSYGKDAIDESSRRGLPDDGQLEEAYQRALRDGADPDIAQRMRGGFTGVVAVLKGKQEGPTVAFRFDMDALPIQESSDSDHVPHTNGFRSIYDGSMHACAHDAHTAIGLDFAKRMASRSFSGTLKLIFQPAEEGGRGAYAMAQKGVVDDVDKLICFHLGLGVPVGTVYGGSTGWLNVTKYLAHFHGYAAHSGLSPEQGRHALLGAASALLHIHAIPRFGKSDTRVNVGKLEGGSSSNIVPGYAKMLLETRATVEEVNAELERRVRNIIKTSAEMYELDYEIEITGGAKSIRCDEELVSVALQAASNVEAIRAAEPIFTASAGEDACFLTERVQNLGGLATYMIIGSDIPYPHHNEKFDIDEAALPIAVELLENIAALTLNPS
jgi:aminobenzoyl-glutamate utilization protein A